MIDPFCRMFMLNIRLVNRFLLFSNRRFLWVRTQWKHGERKKTQKNHLLCKMILSSISYDKCDLIALKLINTGFTASVEQQAISLCVSVCFFFSSLFVLFFSWVSFFLVGGFISFVLYIILFFLWVCSSCCCCSAQFVATSSRWIMPLCVTLSWIDNPHAHIHNSDTLHLLAAVAHSPCKNNNTTPHQMYFSSLSLFCRLLFFCVCARNVDSQQYDSRSLRFFCAHCFYSNNFRQFFFMTRHGKKRAVPIILLFILLCVLFDICVCVFSLRNKDQNECN